MPRQARLQALMSSKFLTASSGRSRGTTEANGSRKSIARGVEIDLRLHPRRDMSNHIGDGIARGVRILICLALTAGTAIGAAMALMVVYVIPWIRGLL